MRRPKLCGAGEFELLRIVRSVVGADGVFARPHEPPHGSAAIVLDRLSGVLLRSGMEREHDRNARHGRLSSMSISPAFRRRSKVRAAHTQVLARLLIDSLRPLLGAQLADFVVRSDGHRKKLPAGRIGLVGQPRCPANTVEIAWWDDGSDD
jgi:hypothetical protein